jgi:hypothetical protein
LASLSKSTVNVTTATAFTSSHTLFKFLKTVLETLFSSSFALFKTRFTKATIAHKMSTKMTSSSGYQHQPDVSQFMHGDQRLAETTDYKKVVFMPFQDKALDG